MGSTQHDLPKSSSILFIQIMITLDQIVYIIYIIIYFIIFIIGMLLYGGMMTSVVAWSLRVEKMNKLKQIGPSSHDLPRSPCFCLYRLGSHRQVRQVGSLITPIRITPIWFTQIRQLSYIYYIIIYLFIYYLLQRVYYRMMYTCRE